MKTYESCVHCKTPSPISKTHPFLARSVCDDCIKKIFQENRIVAASVKKFSDLNFGLM